MTKQPLESKIETYFKEQVAKAQGKAYKFKSSENGVPDQIVLYDGYVFFIELKRPGGKPRKEQIHTINEMQSYGAFVDIISTKEEVDHFINKHLGGIKEKSQKKEQYIISADNAFHIGGIHGS